MYLLLAIAFRSYFQPILIMIAIPFALTGAIFGHFIYDIPIALFSYFGVGAAAGVVINDNLVLIDFVNRLRANGVGAFQALVDAGVQRFRPILLTSVTTFLGIFPMMAEQSTQAQFLKPMVVALGFAVVFALFLTLFFVPALYGIGVDIARFFRGMWTGKKQPSLGSDYQDTDFAHGELPGHLDQSPAE
jgi:multidrug efflux pump subunit AcrB